MKDQNNNESLDIMNIDSPICDFSVINYNMTALEIMPVEGLFPQFQFRESEWVKERFDELLLKLCIDTKKYVSVPELIRRAELFLAQKTSKRDFLIMMIDMTYSFSINHLMIMEHAQRNENIDIKNEAMRIMTCFDLFSVKSLLDFCDIARKKKCISLERFNDETKLNIEPDDTVGDLLDYAFRLAVTKFSTIDRNERSCICSVSDDPEIKVVYEIISNVLIKPIKAFSRN